MQLQENIGLKKFVQEEYPKCFVPNWPKYSFQR